MKHDCQKHKFPKLINCGVYIYKPHPYMGAMPDNIFTCACCENVFSMCAYSISRWNKTSFLELKEKELRLRRNHNFYARIQGQMAITGNRWTYFLAWKVQNSVILFFKVYVRSTLLGFKKLYTCTICSKPGLYDAECETLHVQELEILRILLFATSVKQWIST